ncbi:AmmeMemoRadiSam system radical SAM enzyme [Candidatus Dojkabacteria bacterium]|nr:AmmeMemoRadiSam system radical SAM enzyme [Candidatus Dojkabacteria bacterium]
MKEARFYKKNENDFVTCTACQWQCKIAPGAVGICGTRQNHQGILLSLVYGNAAAVHLDPIEKKPFYHFRPGSNALSIGTLGCNFGCDFCQNWDISQLSKEMQHKLQKKNNLKDLGIEVTKYGYDMSPMQIIEYCMQSDFDCIAYTYNEPTIFAEYALDTAKLAKQKGIKNVFVSNGYMTNEVIEEMSDCIDAANIDIKSFSDKFYRKHCKANLEPVLENIKTLYEKGIWVELVTLLIPGENDSSSELKKIADFIANISVDIPWFVTAFHPDYKLLDKPMTSGDSLSKAYDIGKKAGLHYVYSKNSWKNENFNTYCYNCDELLVERDYVEVRVHESLDINKGICKKCGSKIAGVWK